jgi:lysylphosphatidylglycerol synthetase-like protein (DUF2156 family)
MIDILKTCCKKEIKTYETLISRYIQYGDEGMVNLGAFSSSLAKESGKTMQQTRYSLNKLFKDGKVLRKTTSGGSTRWWPVGLCDELNMNDL